MDYADHLERLSSLGYSAHDARAYVDNGIVPRPAEPDEEEEEQGGCTCRIGSEFCTC